MGQNTFHSLDEIDTYEPTFQRSDSAQVTAKKPNTGANEGLVPAFTKDMYMNYLYFIS